MTSTTYRLMIYFAHSTICFYEKDIKYHEGITVHEVKNLNPKIIQRVFDEGLSIMNYELSGLQINKAVEAYVSNKLQSKSVEETLPYNFENIE